MLKSITAALKLSEIREKLNDLNAVTEPTEAQQTEERDLIASQKKTETEYREALTAEADADTTPTTPDAEERERLQLVSRASLGAIFARAVEHRSTEGAESEVTSGARSCAESGSDRSAARARRGTRDHTGADERGRKRAGGTDAGLRGR